MNHQDHKKEYVYHWHRIFGAAFIGIGVLGLMAYGSYQWLTPDPIDSSLPTAVERAEPATIASNSPTPELGAEHASEDTAVPGEDVTAAAVGEADVLDDARINALDNVQQAATADAADATARLDTLPAPAAGISPDAARTTDERLDTTSTPAQVVAPAPLGESQPTAATPVESTPTAPDPEPATHTIARVSKPELPATAQPPQGVIQGLQTFIDAAEVKRFVLAGAIGGREPRGNLADLRPSEQGTTGVYCFSELTDMRGRKVKYRWLFEGDEIATVPVRVGGNRWRSYSSKLLTQSRSGKWRVELRDQDEKLLAATEFVYAP